MKRKGANFGLKVKVGKMKTKVCQVRLFSIDHSVRGLDLPYRNVIEEKYLVQVCVL